ncbi:FecR domain-containing protein [Olivibacter sp. CPCC 100613]|uniref:FecR family protein n=1 Tax=Olivibacter sp. CPCC 100613 TaxID=3079931 RepID=UPI002FFD430D
MKENTRYQELAAKWLNNTITEDEKKEFADWYNEGQDEELIIRSKFAGSEAAYRKQLFDKIKGLTSLNDTRTRRIWLDKRLIFVAASIVCLMIVGALMYVNKPNAEKQEVAKKAVSIKQGKLAWNQDKTMMRLPNGEAVNLDDLPTGTELNMEGIVIHKLDTNVIRCMNKRSDVTARDQPYHTIVRTPIGKDYKLVLADGSTVWLNAASEISFSFHSKSERRVRLDGEAYFAVNRDGKSDLIPFVVETRQQEVYVLGTEFNIDAYHDDKWARTTLVKGSVKVKQTHTDVEAILKPNQQAKVSHQASKINVRSVDASEVISWKKGYFSFHDSDIQSVLKQFARWYGLEVIYERKQFAETYVGKIPRSLSLTEAIGILETVGVKCKIEGKKLIII